MNYEQFLKEKYNKTALNTKELSVELSGISERMIRDRVYKCSDEIPAFIKVGSRVVFPIKKVAEFLENCVRVG